MIPTSTAALVIVLLAIVPGFVASTVWARSRTWKGPSSDFRTTLQSIALSAAIQVVASPLTIVWIVPHRTDFASHPEIVAVWCFLVVLVLPVALGVGVARLSDWFQAPMVSEVERSNLKFFRRTWSLVVRGNVVPTIWDWLFLSKPPHGRYVVVTFKDGSRVGGVFEHGAYALTSPEARGIYLTQEWALDEQGNFVAKVPGTDGIMINAADVQTVRVQLGNDDKSTDARRDDTRCRPENRGNLTSRSVRGLCLVAVAHLAIHLLRYLLGQRVKRR